MGHASKQSQRLYSHFLLPVIVHSAQISRCYLSGIKLEQLTLPDELTTVTTMINRSDPVAVTFCPSGCGYITHKRLAETVGLFISRYQVINFNFVLKILGRQHNGILFCHENACSTDIAQTWMNFEILR